jgi:diguanylate cyclase (GGDEF)-like protein
VLDQAQLLDDMYPRPPERTDLTGRTAAIGRARRNLDYYTTQRRQKGGGGGRDSQLDQGLRDVCGVCSRNRSAWTRSSSLSAEAIVSAGAPAFGLSNGRWAWPSYGPSASASWPPILCAALRDIIHAMLAIAAGRRAELPGGKQRGEIGQMLEAVAAFRHRVSAQESVAIQRERDLAVQNMRFEAAVNQMAHGLAMFDANLRLIVCNEPYMAIYGLDRETVRAGTHLRDILAARAAAGTASTCGGEVAGFEALAERKAWRRDDTLRNGRIIAVAHQPMADGASVSTHDDVTEQRQADAHIEHLARHDPLTRLPNRTVFRDELAALLPHSSRWNTIAVLCLDLDNFKTVNDSLGHPIGDALLCSVADRLRASVPEDNLVARLGGDEFAIIHRSADRLQSLPALAQRIIEALTEPFLIEGHRICIGASLGIACAPDDSSDPVVLLKNADMALYRAKKENPGAYRRFEPQMAEQENARRTWNSSCARPSPATSSSCIISHFTTPRQRRSPASRR